MKIISVNNGKNILLFFFIILTNIGIAQTVQPKGKTILHHFPLTEVKLLDSKWKQQLDETKEYYLRIPNDDLLKGFRLRAHLPDYGAADMGGWYTLDICNTFGQIVSGLSRLYAATGDEACKIKVTALISGWAACIDSTGYFFYSDSITTTHYTYEKIICGLIDAYTYTGNKDALKYLSVITDWAIKNLSKNLDWAGEWYTLPENLYKAFLITGDKKYYDYANEWEYSKFWNGIKNDSDVFKTKGWYHAYSHLNTFSSAAMAYMVKGDPGYKQTIEHAYDFFQNKECYPTGGFGPNEMLLPQQQFRQTVYGTDRSFETQCGSWAVFKLCKYLLDITGDGRYGDWIEKMMINGIGASIPMSADGGVMYYSDYKPREGFKKNTEDPWSCCTGTRPQAIAEYQDLIYFYSEAGLYVNLYMPSTVNWNGIHFTQQTKFPDENSTSFSFHFPSATSVKKFALHFRKPSWLTGVAIFSLNGKTIVPDTINNWYTITREWKETDKLVITIPMDFSFKSLIASAEYPKTLMYGPVAMAIRTADDNYPSEILNNTHPWKNFTAVQGEYNTWHAGNNSGLLIRPFYEFEEKDPYVILLDTSVQKQVASHNISTHGNWHLFYQFTEDSGATITAKFYGTGVCFKGSRFDDAGMFSVTLDDKLIDTVDLYSAVRGIPFEAKYTGLSLGKHVITIKTLADKNKDSRGHIVNYASIEKIE